MAGHMLSVKLDDPEAIPYFLWDDPMPLSELRTRLAAGSEAERIRLLAAVLREARDTDVWRFTTPSDVSRLWPLLATRLGRRRAFWEFLLTAWEREGLLRDERRLGPRPSFGTQLHPEQSVIDGLVVDPPDEILANKLCTLLSRCEIRDLVDVLMLERAGLRMEDALEPAAAKDGGLTPAQLAWVLSQIDIGPDAHPPGGVSAGELREYVLDLQGRLTRLAFPAGAAS
jgi:hypothetical protein